ncbi:MAG: hypothetical protein IT393_03295 [Nitrospirae bacterium]|nr:hypothetical protein [Nitrospirota bacterium]
MDNKKIYKGIQDRVWIVVHIFFISVILISCGSGGAGTQSTTSPAQGGAALFSAELQDCSSPPPNSVYVCKNIIRSNDDVLAIDVMISSDKPVFGAAFDLLINGASVGVVLKDDHSVDFLQPDPSPEGIEMWKQLFVALDGETLIVGASRGKGLGPLTGKIHVLTLKFKKPAGESPLNFAHNSIIDEKGHPVDIPDERWYGGYFTPGL